MSKRILVVDDDEIVRDALSSALQSQGYDVSEASRLDAGLKIFSTESCDAAIIDYLLPDGTALQLIPRLKAIDATIPVIVMTGHGTIDLAVTAIKLGAEHFITKPVELDVLYQIAEPRAGRAAQPPTSARVDQNAVTIQARSISGKYRGNQEAKE